MSTTTAPAAAAPTTSRPARPARPAIDPDGPLVVYVPQAGGAVIGIVHAAPWLAADVETAKAGTSRGLADWPGQPVFADEATAREWVAWFATVAEETGVDGWTVEPVLVTVEHTGEPHGDALQRVAPVTADGHRAFWRRPGSLLVESARAYLAALGAHLNGHVLPHLELMQAALAGYALDEDTLQQLAGVQRVLAGAAAALVDLAGAAWPPQAGPVTAASEGSGR